MHNLRYHTLLIGMFIAVAILMSDFMSQQSTTIYAQSGDLPPSETVTIESEDGVTRTGEFWTAASDEPAPAILMIHWRNGSHQEWEPLVEPLHAAGYNLLVIDMRSEDLYASDEGYEMDLADAQLWLNWLSEQPNVQPNALVAMGIRRGANVAIIACIKYHNCTTSIALSPTTDSNPTFGYHDSIDLRTALVDIGDINAHSVLVIDQRSAANILDMRHMSDFLCCNIELNMHIYPSDRDYNPDGIQMIEAHMGSALPLITFWVETHTSAETIGLDEFTINGLEIVSNNDPVSPLDTAIEAGGTIDYDLAVIECCYFVVEVETAVEWSIAPSDGATVDRRTGEVLIDADTPVGTSFTLTADVENGRRLLTETLVVTDIANNPLIGNWTEIAQLTCDTGEQVEVEERIGELRIEANGDFSVTWYPFEVYIDYVGTYEFDSSGTLDLYGRAVNYFPPTFDGSGEFSIDKDGHLVLTDIWLGVPPRSSSTVNNCGHVFQRN